LPADHPDACVLWNRGFGGELDDVAAAITTSSTQVVVGGRIRGNAELVTAHETEGYDMFLAGLSTSDGAFVWDLVLKDAGTTQAFWALAADGADGFFGAGETSGYVNFGDGLPVDSDDRDAFFARYDGAGVYQKHTVFVVEGSQKINAIAAGPSGEFAIGGDFEGSIDLGGPPLTAEGTEAGFVAMLEGSLGHRWSRPVLGSQADGAVPSGAPASRLIRAVAIDSRGDVFVVGASESVVTIGSDDSKFGGNVGFVAKLRASDGRPLWTRFYRDVAPMGAAVDGDGNVFVAGSFQGQVDFGLMPMTAERSDVFVLLLGGENGDPLRVTRAGGPGDDFAHAIALGPDGNVVIAGGFTDSLTFDGGTTLEGHGSLDVFVAKLDGGSGALRWGLSGGGPGNDAALALAIDPQGNAVVSGSFAGPLDLGKGRLDATGAADAFVIKLGP
jgi:hypothetical protein